MLVDHKTRLRLCTKVALVFQESAMDCAIATSCISDIPVDQIHNVQKALLSFVSMNIENGTLIMVERDK